MRCYWNECASTNNDSTETNNSRIDEASQEDRKKMTELDFVR